MDFSVICINCQKEILVPSGFFAPIIICKHCGKATSLKPAVATKTLNGQGNKQKGKGRFSYVIIPTPAFIDDLENFLDPFHKLSLDVAEQSRYLGAVRTAFWKQEWEIFHILLRKAEMNEQEIIARKGFFQRLALQLGRYLRLIPQLAECAYIGFIGEDMIDTGDPDLVNTGNALYGLFKALESGNSFPQYKGNLPILRVDAEELEFFRKNPWFLLEEIFDLKWSFNDNLDENFAIAVEMLLMKQHDADFVIKRLFGQDATLHGFLGYFAQTMANHLTQIGYSSWGEFICRIIEPYAGEESLGVKMKRTELLLLLNKDQEAYQLMREFRKKRCLPKEFELAYLHLLFQNEGADEAILFAHELITQPEKIVPVLGILSELLRETGKLGQALKCASTAFHYAPNEIAVLYTLARAFQAMYFSKQVDLCLERLRKCPEYLKKPEDWLLPVELFIKCDEDETQIMFDSTHIGKCPIRIGTARAGSHVIEWILPSGKRKRKELNLKEATIHKIHYHPAQDSFTEEISRDGHVAMISPEGVISLTEKYSKYLVEDLNMLPKNSPEEALKPD